MSTVIDAQATSEYQDLVDAANAGKTLTMCTMMVRGTIVVP